MSKGNSARDNLAKMISSEKAKASHEFSGQHPELTSVALCHRSYDPEAGGISAYTGKPQHGIEAWTKGETYSCHGYVTGWVRIEDNSGVIHELPNAAFASYFRWL